MKTEHDMLVVGPEAGELTPPMWRRVQASSCPRTFAIWKPGEAIEGVAHRPAWSGRVPMTGEWACKLCGQEIPR